MAFNADFHVYFVGGSTYRMKIENIRKIPSLVLNDPIEMEKFYDRQQNLFFLTRNRSFFEFLVFYVEKQQIFRPLDIPQVYIYIEDKGLSIDFFVLLLFFQDVNFGRN